LDGKRCNRCGAEKPCSTEYFAKDKAAAGGLSHRCKLCASADGKAWRGRQIKSDLLEKERMRLAILRAIPEQKEKARLRLNRWRQKNPEKAKAQKHAQPEMKAERQTRRNATKLHATPPWADFDAIQKLYALSKELTTETGIKHEVDHIIPLRGKNVTGLHVHQNLRVIPKAENASKGNRFYPELLGEIS